MRLIALLVLVIGFSDAPANATTYELNSSGYFQIDGPFSGPDTYVPVELSATFTGGVYDGPLPALGPFDDNNAYGYTIIARANSEVFFSACSSSLADARCGRELPPVQTNSVAVNADAPFLSIDIAATSNPFSQITPIVMTIDITLPDGFTLESPGLTDAVPEPSTWAMLMIGFAAMGFAGYRRGAPNAWKYN